MRLFAHFVVGIFLLSGSFAMAYTSPGAPAGFVNDYAGVIPEPDQVRLETELAQLAASSSVEIAVVTLGGLDGDTIENVAVKLFEEWGIGDETSDSGILLLFAMEERAVRIEVGYGLEGALTDAQSSAIIRSTIVPAFREGQYASGIEAAVQEVKKAIGGEKLTVEEGASEFFLTPEFLNIVNTVAVPIFVFLTFIFSLTRSYWLGGVLGAGLGAGIGFFMSSFGIGAFAAALLGLLGLLIDYLFSGPGGGGGGMGGRTLGGFSRGSSGGSFGGFGGGRSGGGGASGGW
jgi:uncharacterized protein